MRQTRIINLYGGPGSGKSTTMAALYVELKRRGHLVEMSTEWVKGPVWNGETHVLEDQLYIFAKQNRQLRRLKGKVDFVVTDAPLLLALVYSPPRQLFFQFVAEVTSVNYDNVDVFVRRVKPYEPAGRVQTEDAARKLDERMKSMLTAYVGNHYTVAGDEHAAERILEQIL